VTLLLEEESSLTENLLVLASPGDDGYGFVQPVARVRPPCVDQTLRRLGTPRLLQELLGDVQPNMSKAHEDERVRTVVVGE